MVIKVTPMTPSDVQGAIDTIQQAFADDPYHLWVHDPKTFSTTRNRTSIGLRCTWGMKHGIYHIARDPDSATPDRILGTAMWLAPQAPNAPQSWAEYFSAWQLWLGQVYMNTVYGRGGLNVRRYYIWKAAQNEAQSVLWDDPRGYYFCNIVTVLPEAQGKGVGRALMDEVLREADAKGMRCYLESSRRVPNVAIYERFGFELVKSMWCDDDGQKVELFCMMREPRTLHDSEDAKQMEE